MPIKLYPPGARSKNYRIRGTYLKVRVDESAGTDRRHVAQRKLKQIEDQIERGAFGEGPSFLTAVHAYLDQGGQNRFLEPIVRHFNDYGMTQITQQAVDEAAKVLYPPGIRPGRHPHNATINRQLHTPVSAIMNAAGVRLNLRRPKQPTGRVRWLSQDEAEALIDACDDKLKPMVIFLLYSGCRLGEAVNLRWREVELDQASCLIKKTKTDTPRRVHLPPQLVVTLANLPSNREPAERVFGYGNRHVVYEPWYRACGRAGISDFTPHDLCHTWATWMRRFGGLDLTGLAGTGRWKDARSAARYTHVVPGEDSLAADLLPNVLGRKSGQGN